jgi:hypothetical protein
VRRADGASTAALSRRRVGPLLTQGVRSVRIAWLIKSRRSSRSLLSIVFIKISRNVKRGITAPVAGDPLSIRAENAAESRATPKQPIPTLSTYGPVLEPMSSRRSERIPAPRLPSPGHARSVVELRRVRQRDRQRVRAESAPCSVMACTPASVAPASRSSDASRPPVVPSLWKDGTFALDEERQ